MERHNFQQSERRISEERRQKQSLEAQLNNERKQRKQAEEKAARYIENCKLKLSITMNNILLPILSLFLELNVMIHVKFGNRCLKMNVNN